MNVITNIWRNFFIFYYVICIILIIYYLIEYIKIIYIYVYNDLKRTFIFLQITLLFILNEQK